MLWVVIVTHVDGEKEVYGPFQPQTRARQWALNELGDTIQHGDEWDVVPFIGLYPSQIASGASE
jgi:hypothetical protein